MAELITDWSSLAACRDGDPDAMFVQGAEQNVAKRICRGCPVRYECLADALDNRIEFGVWGGKTERERRALLRRYPNVESWWRAFELAKQDPDFGAERQPSVPRQRNAEPPAAAGAVALGGTEGAGATIPRQPKPEDLDVAQVVCPENTEQR